MALLGVNATSAFAQTEEEESVEETKSEENNDEVIDKITVTGSRIKRSNIETATPVTVITSEDIEKQGHANVFEAIAVAEKQHEKRYLDLAANIEAGRVFKRDTEVVWRCRNCGYLHTGSEAPETCPACAHPKTP